MSAPFDPTKLDLDMNKSPDKEIKVPVSELQNEVIQEKTEQDDILNDIVMEETPKERKEEVKNQSPDSMESGLKEIIEEKKLIDINIESLESIVTLIHEKEHDYVLIEPEDMQVKVTFRQDNIDRDVRYIKFPVYTNILFKLKQLAGLVMDAT